MSERDAVQNPMLRYADEIGWEPISASQALQMRGGDITKLYFPELLETQLLKLNGEVLDEDLCKEILRQLNLLNPTRKGNQEALLWLRGERSIFVPSQDRERNVTLIDFDTPEGNLFHVTDEWWQKNPRDRNRADVVFLINGIPVAVVETKSAHKRDGLAEGVDQIRRYHRETPEMFTTPQLFGVTQLLDFFYGVTWNTSRKNLFNWKADDPANYEDKVKTFFEPARLLKILRESIIFLSRDDELTKVVLRQHQTRAVEDVVERVYDPTKRRGLIWHTQGSGKTLTMITIASRLLRRGGETEKPTVLMLVDRNELESQLFKNITAYGIATPTVAKSIRDLRRILSSDYRGLVVSTIHKFDKIPANINVRESVTVLVDEAHRTTGGDLGNYLMGAFPNATYIGFTGTPIDALAHGKGTFKVFGADDENGYLDKYSIAESIEDRTTVPLNYALAPSGLQVESETLEREFLGLAAAEGVSDVEELNAILDRAVGLKQMMKAPDRVDEVARYAAEHFRENVRPMGFKAFLVGVDREACALYKEALDNYLPAECSAVIFSPDNRDHEFMKAHHRNEDEEREIRKRFADKNDSLKILIVTEKLLTGFDAPILYCMYLDKPMRDHVLLQAIARVNRPYEDDDGLVKPYGFVLDFVGIFENLEKALAFDSDVVGSVIKNLDVLRKEFAKRFREAAPRYMSYAHSWDDRGKERAIAYFGDKERREEFFKFFRGLQDLYNILSPDAFLRPFLKDYRAVASLYALIRHAYADTPYVDKEIVEKTRNLLQEHTESDDFELPGAIHELNADTLREVADSELSDTVKVLNLRKILQKTVTEESDSNPFLLSIGERADAVAEAYENRQMTTQEALAQFQRIAEDLNNETNERERLGLDLNAYAVYTVLKKVSEEVTPEQARTVDEVFDQFPDYEWDYHQTIRLRTQLYKRLRPILTVEQEELIKITTRLMANNHNELREPTA